MNAFALAQIEIHGTGHHQYSAFRLVWPCVELFLNEVFEKLIMLDLIGYAAGFFLMWSFLPQVIKTATTRSTEGLSVPMLVITLISGILYEIYAYLLGLMPVIIMNGIFVLTVSIQLVMTLMINRSSGEQE
jgi:uncharacterized protein with PQ loop repeat